MKFAYADPPYFGCCALYGHTHGPVGCWDDLTTHEQLVDQLNDGYDGWALSASMKSAVELAPLMPPETLMLSWHKPVSPPMGDKRHYDWEPVFMRPLRNPKVPTRTTLVLSPPQFTFREKPPGHVVGEKPEGFCHWLFDCAGLQPDDHFDDFFYGSGAVLSAWESWQRQGVLL